MHTLAAVRECRLLAKIDRLISLLHVTLVLYELNTRLQIGFGLNELMP